LLATLALCVTICPAIAPRAPLTRFCAVVDVWCWLTRKRGSQGRLVSSEQPMHAMNRQTVVNRSHHSGKEVLCAIVAGVRDSSSQLAICANAWLAAMSMTAAIARAIRDGVPGVFEKRRIRIVG
jgi:hypothetical protein